MKRVSIQIYLPASAADSGYGVNSSGIVYTLAHQKDNQSSCVREDIVCIKVINLIQLFVDLCSVLRIWVGLGAGV